MKLLYHTSNERRTTHFTLHRRKNDRNCVHSVKAWLCCYSRIQYFGDDDDDDKQQQWRLHSQSTSNFATKYSYNQLDWQYAFIVFAINKHLLSTLCVLLLAWYLISIFVWLFSFYSNVRIHLQCTLRSTTDFFLWHHLPFPRSPSSVRPYQHPISIDIYTFPIVFLVIIYSSFVCIVLFLSLFGYVFIFSLIRTIVLFDSFAYQLWVSVLYHNKKIPTDLNVYGVW